MPIVRAILSGLLLGGLGGWLSFFVLPGFVPTFFQLIAGLLVCGLTTAGAFAYACGVIGRRMEMAALVVGLYSLFFSLVGVAVVAMVWTSQHVQIVTR